LGDVDQIAPFLRPAIRLDERQAAHAQKMEALGQITGGIAHELNNMLLAINLNLEALTEEVPASQTTQPLFDGAQQSIDQAKALILQLLAFSRRQPLDAGDFDLNRAVLETRLLLRLVLPANIEVETRLCPGAAFVFADRYKFEMALINVALNAGDAMPRGGKLTIETARTDDEKGGLTPGLRLTGNGYVSIAVSDTGVGMAREVAERAFEPFFTTKANLGHSGLGLSQVYGYVEQSAGQVELDSGAEGTTVRILLPNHRARAPASPRAGPLGRGRGETILMVEDAPLVRLAVARMLDELGYQVLVAAGAEAALAFIESDSRIDLLFTDIMLPGALAGDELAIVARRLRRLAADAVRFQLLSKPYTKTELAARLRAVLDAALPGG
jgi:nitrogen-specific signal transduction histidine kinase/CheY-like chemotaxis protein